MGIVIVIVHSSMGIDRVNEMRPYVRRCYKRISMRKEKQQEAWVKRRDEQLEW